jgi:hypothetical protein
MRSRIERLSKAISSNGAWLWATLLSGLWATLKSMVRRGTGVCTTTDVGLWAGSVTHDEGPLLLLLLIAAAFALRALNILSSSSDPSLTVVGIPAAWLGFNDDGGAYIWDVCVWWGMQEA